MTVERLRDSSLFANRNASTDVLRRKDMGNGTLCNATTVKI
jgi:hypothetical protein